MTIECRQHQWRSVLFVPAHNQKLVCSALRRGADVLLLDLEDSVPNEQKTEARSTLTGTLQLLGQGSADIAVRVNRPLSACLQDLDVAVQQGVSAIFVPKVMSADHMRLLDEVIAELELERGMQLGGVKLVAIVETAAALLRVESIAKACPRLVGLALGSEDLSLDIGFEPRAENLLAPCQALVLAARAAGVCAWGFPGSIANLCDMDRFSTQVQRGKSMGFSGVLCIHPKQMVIVNRVYTACESDIMKAKKMIAAYDAALVQGEGAVGVEGEMVDAPVYRRAKNLLDNLSRTE